MGCWCWWVSNRSGWLLELLTVLTNIMFGHTYTVYESDLLGGHVFHATPPGGDGPQCHILLFSILWVQKATVCHWVHCIVPFTMFPMKSCLSVSRVFLFVQYHATVLPEAKSSRFPSFSSQKGFDGFSCFCPFRCETISSTYPLRTEILASKSKSISTSTILTST